jgi:hypothetical protein
MADGTLKVGTITTSSGSGTITLGQSGETVDMANGSITLNSSMKNTPAFEATLGSNQTISNNAYVKVTIDTEVYDSDGKFASNKFTPTVAGKYFVYGSAKLVTDIAQLQLGNCAIYKNGSIYAERQIDFRSSPAYGCNVDVSATIDMDEDDYVELYVKIYKTSGTAILVSSTNKTTNFGAYRIIGA